jgi:hypothetical protein
VTNVEQAMRVLQTLVEAAGGSLDPMKHILGQAYADDVVKNHAEQVRWIHDKAIAGFFHCAASDTAFADAGRIESHYGRSLKEVYPDATRTFMKLARTYWTFKVTLIDCAPDASVCVKLLWAIDETFAGVFFPTPGPMSPPKSLREEMMREVIQGSGANFDVEDYIRNNYYLR